MTAQPASRAILITGASTGIGLSCALRLDSLGCRVFATVRSAADADSLRARASERLTPLLMDVTEGRSIEQTREIIAAAVGDHGLSGLVNNAGVAVAGPLEFVPLDALRRQIEINVVGQVAVMQAMMPLLRQGRGRIVYVGSIGGRSAIPFYGPYCASKFALEAIADAQRVELRPWGMHVAIIEPGSIATPIWQKSLGKAEDSLRGYPLQAHELYGPAMAAMVDVSLELGARGVPAERVADAVVHALTARRPRSRYVIGPDARLRLLLEALPTPLRDWLIGRAISGR